MASAAMLLSRESSAMHSRDNHLVIDRSTLRRIPIAAAMLVLLALSCRTAGPAHPGDAFWAALQPLCGKAFAGSLVEGTEPSDADIGKQSLVMHVRQCSASEIRIPFHVGENRSRTWVLTRTTDGVRLNTITATRTAARIA